MTVRHTKELWHTFMISDKIPTIVDHTLIYYNYTHCSDSKQTLCKCKIQISYSLCIKSIHIFNTNCVCFKWTSLQINADNNFHLYFTKVILRIYCIFQLLFRNSARNFNAKDYQKNNNWEVLDIELCYAWNLDWTASIWNPGRIILHNTSCLSPILYFCFIVNQKFKLPKTSNNEKSYLLNIENVSILCNLKKQKSLHF